MNKIELLLPAGNLEKLKYALRYGADAVYIGAKQYSLRAQASNFSLEEIKEGVDFAHNLKKKVYVTANIIPHSFELDGVEPYLRSLEEIGVDGIIVSSPAILKIAKDKTKLHVSLSTQQSVTSSLSVKLFSDAGIDRIVLARELTIEEIKEIKANTKAELEVFVEGGMCSGYSGRCTLSNYLSNRDANRGGCAHSCRWNYDLYLNGEKINHSSFFEIASKDLSGIECVKDLIEAGVDSLKVEGRMKSIHYVSTVAYTYRCLIDDIYNHQEKPISYYKEMLDSCENRDSSTGFLKGLAGVNQTLYSQFLSQANQNFAGIVLSYNRETKEALIEVRNYFDKDSYLEIMSPELPINTIHIDKIIKDGEEVDAARHALEKVVIISEVELHQFDILRRIDK